MHGAPIQCTRGKCSKAFHVSCAREGAEHGIVYKELGEVEKDVVLVDMGPTSTTLPAPINVSVNDVVSPPQDTSDGVDAMACDKDTVKVVKKVEFQLLCPQHNPVSGVVFELDVAPFFLSIFLAHARSKESEQARQNSEGPPRPRADVKNQDSR